ncbi:DUF6418 domain-containing protein [Pseudomonas kulmbachensis]|uniref:DUF6418 domain-containing protein n=1 Tax=Pseudomonas kulmbachensis TaxID=3043408 RepID=A0ABW7LT66_9PSED
MNVSCSSPIEYQRRQKNLILASKWCPIIVGFSFFLALAWAITSFTYLETTTSSMKELDSNSGSTSNFYPLLALGLLSALFFFIGISSALPNTKESPTNLKRQKFGHYFAKIFLLTSVSLSLIYIAKGWSPLLTGADRFQNYGDINPAIKIIAGQLTSLPIILGALYKSIKKKTFAVAILSGIVFLVISGEKFSGLIAFTGSLTIGLVAAGLAKQDIPKKKMLIAIIAIFTTSIFLGYQNKDSAYDAAEERFLIMQGQVWWEVSNSKTGTGNLESIEKWMGNAIPASMYESYASRGVVLSMGGVPLIYKSEPVFSFIIIPLISVLLGITLGITAQLLKRKKFISALLVFKSYIYLSSVFLMGEFSEIESLKFVIYLLTPIIPIAMHINIIKLRKPTFRNRSSLAKKIQ